jgi:hypothetical protein
VTDRGQDGDKGRVGFIGGRAHVDMGIVEMRGQGQWWQGTGHRGKRQYRGHNATTGGTRKSGQEWG